MKVLSDMKRKIILVIVCHFMHMISAGMSLSFGVLYREMRLDLGTSHSEAAWIPSIFNGLLGLIGIPLGLITTKIGERWPVVCGSILLALGMMTSMFATRISTLYLTYGLLAGLGAGTTHYCAYTALTQHFDAKWRPVALSVASAGVPLSALILPPVMTVLIEQFDWQKTLMVLACISIIGVPSGLLFFQPTKTSDSCTESTSGQNPVRKSLPLKMLRNPDFILYIASSIIIFAVAYVPATFLPDLMHEFKKSPKEVYICLMTMGLCDLVGRLLFGAFVHKMPRYMPFIHSAGVMLLSLSSGLIILSRSFGTFLIMSGILGLGLGCYAGMHFLMATRLLPLDDVRFGYGIVLTFGGIALATGMPLAGFVTDSVKSEIGAFIFASVLFFIGCFLECIIGIREIFWKTSTAVEPRDNHVTPDTDIKIQKDVTDINSVVIETTYM